MIMLQAARPRDADTLRDCLGSDILRARDAVGESSQRRLLELALLLRRYEWPSSTSPLHTLPS